jgi:hypothetical protein
MKEYSGTVYTGIVGGDLEYGQCRDSIQNIVRRAGDDIPRFVRATKGYEARQMHVNAFIESKHDFILLLDHDMLFAPDTLERLRNHKLPYVTGAYMRRQYEPMSPVWFQANRAGLWPMLPAFEVPDRVTEVGASGWGCILIHRDVITAVREMLHGEPEVVEDDMDVWPYDLDAVLGAVHGLQELVQDRPAMRTLRPALEAHTATLVEQLRPLRGTKDPIGSDIRFPFFARVAGFPLYIDPAVTPGHILHYPVVPSDFMGVPEETRQGMKRYNGKNVRAARRRWRERIEELKTA